MGISKTIKVLEKFNGQTKGIEGIRLLLLTYVSSNEKTIIAYMRTLGALGILEEQTQGHFKINTRIKLDNLEAIDEKIINEQLTI